MNLSGCCHAGWSDESARRGEAAVSEGDVRGAPALRVELKSHGRNPRRERTPPNISERR